MKVAIRRIGTLQGIVLPKSVLVKADLGDQVELSVEDGAIVLRKPATQVRVGWADAARRIADCADDALVMGEFANDGDAGREWSSATTTDE